TFPWWNGFFEKDVPFKMGLNTATAKYYIDFCAEAGIPYHSLDGVDNVAWYGGPMVNFLRRAVKLAADNHITVTLHGVSKPTGLERTYPNLLTSEAVLNLEYDKWDKLGCPPDHQLTVAFTRALAGPLDFHQGSFRGVPVEQF